MQFVTDITWPVGIAMLNPWVMLHEATSYITMQLLRTFREGAGTSEKRIDFRGAGYKARTVVYN
jgi:hypothetical protein